MKIAYLGKIQLSDVDLSYLNAAQKQADITYILEITPRFNQGPAFNINKIYNKSGIFKAVEVYPEFSKYSSFIDINKFYVVNTSGRLWQLKAFWTNFLLVLFLIKNNFDLIHLVWPPNIYEFALYLLKKKMMLTVHDPFPHTGLDTFIVRLRRKFAFKFIKKLIILNKNQKQDFIYFYNIDKSRIISSRLSCYTYLKTIKPKTESAFTDKPYILFIGKISPYKGIDYLLPAMEMIHKEHPNINLIVAGGGKYHFDITKYKSLDYIKFRNRFIPDDELVTLIKGSLFMVCPYTDATQSGVAMSAFAFAKPVVATNVGGLPEMIKDNRYGIIVKEKDKDSLAIGLTTLLNNKELIKEFSKNISDDYSTGEKSWSYISEQLLNEIKND